MKRYQVGGVIYALSKIQPKKENDLPDISSMKSMVHEPVVITEEVETEGYQPRFNFRNTSQTQENTEQSQAVEIPIIQHKPAVKNLVFDLFEDKGSSSQTHDVAAVPSNSNRGVWNSVWNKWGSKLGLKDEKAYLYLLGQIQHESDDFKYMQEIASGDAYEGRANLGNIRPGDGRRFKGRGPIQVTGRSNYEKIYKDFFVPNGLGQYDIVNNPELANDPEIGSLLTIGWLAVTENGKRAIAESNNYNVEALTRAINGGSNGLHDRIRRTNDLLTEYNYS